MTYASCRRFGFLLLTILVAILLDARALAYADRTELDVTNLAGGVTLLTEIEVLEDASRALTFQDVSRPAQSTRFRRMTEEALFGFTSSAIWVRFVARNPSDKPQSWLLELPYPHLDQIDYYAVHPDGRVDHQVAGDSLPFAARTVDVPTFVFAQEAKPREQTVYYLRAVSGGVVRVPLRGWLALDFVAHETRHELVLWLFYGGILMMSLYNLGVALLLRKREYPLLVGLVVAVGGAIFSLSGQMFQYVLPDWPEAANRALPVCMALGTVFIELYAREIVSQYDELRSKVRGSPFALPVLVVLLAVAVLSRWGLRAEFVAIALYLPYGVHKIIAIYRHGLAQMRFHLLSFCCLSVSIPIALAAHAKLIPPYPVFIWAGHIGCAGFAILTSLALPARINAMSDRLARLNVQLSLHVSDLKLALGRAEEATDEARRATKVKDEFMATMSHELRTPLNAIINVPQGLLDDFPVVAAAICSACKEEYVLEPGELFDHTNVCEVCHAQGTLRDGQTIRYTGDPRHTARFLRKIERSGQHLLQMVNGVLDFSKMEAGHLRLALEPLDLKPLLIEAIDAMSDLALARQVSVELGTPETQEPGVADAVRIRQVLLNLLSNAIKFSEPGGKIVVTWARDKEYEWVSVQDQGIGIAREDHERVFASFEQVHKGDTRKYGGTGLGLSISRSLVRMHGGELWVESTLGAGSTFKFTLPRRQQSAPGQSSALSAEIALYRAS